MPNLFNLIDTVNVNDARELLASEKASAALNNKRAGRSPLAHAERALTRGTEELEQARSNGTTSTARIEMLQVRIDGISEIMGLIRDKMEELNRASQTMQALFSDIAQIHQEIGEIDLRERGQLLQSARKIDDITRDIASVKI